MRRYRTVIVIALLGIVPMAGAVFVMRFILPAAEPEQVPATVPAQQAAPPPVVEGEPDQVMVLAAASPLPVGTLLGERHLSEVGLDEELVGRRHIETGDLDYDELPYGYVVREAIPAGAAVTRSSLVGPRQRGFLSAVLKPGMRAITVRLGPGTRHSGLVDPGDRVDVVLTAASRERGGENVLARTILEDVRVVAVDRRIGGGSADGGGEVERTEIVTATLEVLPSQTGFLALGELEGELSLAVRPLAAAGSAPERAQVVDMRSLLALPQEIQGQRTVRVVRGNAVTELTFGAQPQSAAHPEGVSADNDLAAGPDPESRRVVSAERPAADGVTKKPVDRRLALVGDAEAQMAVEFGPSWTEGVRGASSLSVAPNTDATASLSATGAHHVHPADALAQRPASAAGLAGAAPEPAGAAETRTLAPLAQESQRVRVVRGGTIDEVAFGAAAQPAAGPENDQLESGPESGQGSEPLHVIAVERPGIDGVSKEPIDRGVASDGEAEPVAAGLDLSSAEGVPIENGPSAATDAEAVSSLSITDPDADGVPAHRPEGGAGLAVAESESAGVVKARTLAPPPQESQVVRVVRGGAVDDVAFGAAAQPAAIPESDPVESGPESGQGSEPLHVIAADRPGIDSVLKEPSVLAEYSAVESGQDLATDAAPTASPSAMARDPGGVLVQRLAGGVGPGSTANLETATGNAVGLAAVSPPPASVPVEAERSAVAALRPVHVSRADRPGPGDDGQERVGLGAAPARQAGPAPEIAFSPSPTPLSSSARGRGAEPDLAAGLALEPLRPFDADRPGPGVVPEQSVSPEAQPSEEAEAAPPVEQAASITFPSLPVRVLSENGTVIAGGGALLLGWVGAFAWLRRQGRPLRRRLQAVGAPLTGHGAVEQVAAEESIFRPTRPGSRLSWLWRRMERRYPLIDAPSAFPRLLGIGVLAAVGVWAGMWVLGMSGWWSMPAAVLAGFGGAWYALRQMQTRQEKRFVQRFPEIVDQIVRLSVAGLPPLEALGKVAEDAQPPVKGVLEEVSDALLAGLDADTALDMVAARVRLAEFTLFAAVIRLQRRAGGSISSSMTNLSTTLRERQTTAVKARSATAQTRLTLLVLMLMPPLVFGVQSMTTPDFIDRLFNTEDGRLLLQLGVGLILAGLVTARQIAARGPR